MLGYYENFPDIYHGIARFSHSILTRELQRVIIQSLYRLNQGGKESQLIYAASRLGCEVILEFGIGEGFTFNYLDKEMLESFLKRLRGETFSLLDFFCIARYYVTDEEKRRPLKFDYYILRFIFYEREVELRIFHERGTRRLPIGVLIRLLRETMNRELSRKRLSPVNLDYLRAL